MGCDIVHSHILRECAESFSISLELLFNRSFEQGKVPTAKLVVNITPLHKKGNNTYPTNYRPVSLTSVVCKVMERIVKQVIIDYSYKFKLLLNQKHRFLKQKGCVTNLLETFYFLATVIASGDSADLLFLDFAKTFDKVPYRRLLHKLKAKSIEGKLSKWIEACKCNSR